MQSLILGINICFFGVKHRVMKYPELHPYSDRAAFERLLLLIATFVQYPGIGCREEETAPGDHNALEVVAERLNEVAQQMGFELPYDAPPTLRKDLETLRDYGILERRMYRWGYYLGTGGMDRSAFAAAVQALRSQAQSDPEIQRLYQGLEKRLRGMNLALEGRLFYPVRSQLERTIVNTDPEEMRRQRNYRQTLFERLDVLERAIVRGQAVELMHRANPYGKKPMGRLQVYPLQLVYHEIAWYLLCEECEEPHWSMLRLDRLDLYLQVLGMPERGTQKQLESLGVGRRLLRNGWGLFLGDRPEQRLEREGLLELVEVRVRFFEGVAMLICEGEKRHPRQRIVVSRDEGGRLEYADYRVRLPERSLPEFFRWVNRFMDQAQVLLPMEWVERYEGWVRGLSVRYCV